MITLNIKQSVIINQPLEEIFTYLSNLENLVDWSNIIIAIEKISPGELGIGARVQCTVRFLGKWLTMTFEIVEYEPNRCLSIKSITGVAPCLFCYQIEPDENGMVILSQEVIIHLTEEMLDLTTSSLTSVVRCQLAYDLRTLKDVLESRPFPV